MSITNGSVSAWLVGRAGSVSASEVDGGRTLTESRDMCCNMHADAMSNGSVTASLVLEPSLYPYLRVYPEQPLWIDVGADIDYLIRSNTDWLISDY